MIDVVYIPIAVAILLIIVGIAYFLFGTIGNAIFGPNALNLPQFTLNQTWKNAFTYFFIMFYFGLPLAGIILATISGTHPIFLPLGIILLIVGIFVFGIMKEVTITIFNNFNLTRDLFSSNVVLSKMLEYYPFIMGIFGVLIIGLQHAFGLRAE
jgi:hypothetical protein